MGVETPIPQKMINAAATDGAPPRRIKTVEIMFYCFSMLECEPDRFMPVFSRAVIFYRHRFKFYPEVPEPVDKWRCPVKQRPDIGFARDQALVIREINLS